MNRVDRRRGGAGSGFGASPLHRRKRNYALDSDSSVSNTPNAHEQKVKNIINGLDDRFGINAQFDVGNDSFLQTLAAIAHKQISKKAAKMSSAKRREIARARLAIARKTAENEGMKQALIKSFTDDKKLEKLDEEIARQKKEESDKAQQSSQKPQGESPFDTMINHAFFQIQNRAIATLTTCILAVPMLGHSYLINKLIINNKMSAGKKKLDEITEYVTRRRNILIDLHTLESKGGMYGIYSPGDSYEEFVLEYFNREHNIAATEIGDCITSINRGDLTVTPAGPSTPASRRANFNDFINTFKDTRNNANGDLLFNEAFLEYNPAPGVNVRFSTEDALKLHFIDKILNRPGPQGPMHAELQATKEEIIKKNLMERYKPSIANIAKSLEKEANNISPGYSFLSLVDGNSLNSATSDTELSANLRENITSMQRDGDAPVPVLAREPEMVDAIEVYVYDKLLLHPDLSPSTRAFVKSALENRVVEIANSTGELYRANIKDAQDIISNSRGIYNSDLLRYIEFNSPDASAMHTEFLRRIDRVAGIAYPPNSNREESNRALALYTYSEVLSGPSTSDENKPALTEALRIVKSEIASNKPSMLQLKTIVKDDEAEYIEKQRQGADTVEKYAAISAWDEACIDIDHMLWQMMGMTPEDPMSRSKLMSSTKAGGPAANSSESDMEKNGMALAMAGQQAAAQAAAVPRGPRPGGGTH